MFQSLQELSHLQELPHIGSTIGFFFSLELQRLPIPASASGQSGFSDSEQ